MYASETWISKKLDRDRSLAFEMKCYRRILRIRWKQKITNEKERSRVRCMKNMVQLIMERTLNVFGHICGTMDTMMVKEVLEFWRERQGKEDRAENRWTTSRNVAEKKFAHSTGRRRVAVRGEW